MNVEKAAEALGVGRSFVYELCSLHAPRLRHLRLGAKIEISPEAIEEYRRSCEVCPVDPWAAPAAEVKPEQVRRVRGLTIPDEWGRIERERAARRKDKSSGPR